MLAVALAVPAAAWAQTTAAERFKALADPDGLEKYEKKEKEKARPPLEFFRSQIAPFDVLPYIKPGHWNTLSLECRANYADYDGYLQSAPVRLLNMPHAVVFRRDARLPKEQDSRLSMQVLLPQHAKELLLELARPEAIRADGGWQASLLALEPHQMLIPVLSSEPSAFAPWSRMHAVLPASGDKDAVALEKQRYYKLVLPQNPDKPPLSPHPLTWTTTSHLLWDGLEPETLNTAQQRALLDWLHWGGQLIVVAAGPSVASLQESFLGPYLPATLSGRNASLLKDELEPLGHAYPPPVWPIEWEEARDFNTQGERPPRYKLPQPLKPAAPR
ncbi:MAG: hypothetical protein IRY99_19205, partial [Isosphaeraceae bacterium]|nr:hypothetical protein [Isosphaeraceae bacterium]